MIYTPLAPKREVQHNSAVAKPSLHKAHAALQWLGAGVLYDIWGTVTLLFNLELNP